MRKEAGFEVMDKIAVSYEGTEKAEKVFADNASTIADETLALEVAKQHQQATRKSGRSMEKL